MRALSSKRISDQLLRVRLNANLPKLSYQVRTDVSRKLHGKMKTSVKFRQAVIRWKQNQCQTLLSLDKQMEISKLVHVQINPNLWAYQASPLSYLISKMELKTSRSFIKLRDLQKQTRDTSLRPRYTKFHHQLISKCTLRFKAKSQSDE